MFLERGLFGGAKKIRQKNLCGTCAGIFGEPFRNNNTHERARILFNVVLSASKSAAE